MTNSLQANTKSDQQFQPHDNLPTNSYLNSLQTQIM
jgi:hypothetical protein